MPTLYLVGTPIGNLEDITLRALRILKEAPLAAAEDTRRAKVLFQRHGISTPLVSYHEQGAGGKVAQLLERLRRHDVALITEAGMPSISDPGFGLVRAAIEQGIRVEVIPGPSAVPTAVALSGLPSDRFTFIGFLPRAPGERRRLLESLARQPWTLVAFESPHRVQGALKDIAAILGAERPIAVCRELTKLHEEVFRGTAQEAAERFAAPKGEFTLVIGGAGESAPAAMAEQDVARLVEQFRRSGVAPNEAVGEIARQTGRPRREVYQLWIGKAKGPR
ncbi:MAG: 16S rRNA (cytidine(1402)-2'-O)-methyltransferase [Chloroflexi bacterium]|nr:16S rRNA (cytidine(1402)-2'-O)-methyltransferase [Chloroflexota bacterium]